MTTKKKNTIELVEVIVKPLFVRRDSNGTLSRLEVPPATVSAADWPSFSTEGFAVALAELEDSLDKG